MKWHQQQHGNPAYQPDWGEVCDGVVREAAAEERHVDRVRRGAAEKQRMAVRGAFGRHFRGDGAAGARTIHTTTGCPNSCAGASPSMRATRSECCRRERNDECDGLFRKGGLRLRAATSVPADMRIAHGRHRGRREAQ